MGFCVLRLADKIDANLSEMKLTSRNLESCQRFVGRSYTSQAQTLAWVIEERHRSILETLANIITSSAITVAAAVRVADGGNDLH